MEYAAGYAFLDEVRRAAGRVTHDSRNATSHRLVHHQAPRLQAGQHEDIHRAVECGHRRLIAESRKVDTLAVSPRQGFQLGLLRTVTNEQCLYPCVTSGFRKLTAGSHKISRSLDRDKFSNEQSHEGIASDPQSVSNGQSFPASPGR